MACYAIFFSVADEMESRIPLGLLHAVSGH